MSNFHISTTYVDIMCRLDRSEFMQMASYLECHCTDSEFKGFGRVPGTTGLTKSVLKVATHELEAVKKRLLELGAEEIEQ